MAAETKNDDFLNIVIKWNGTEHPISNLDVNSSCLADLRSEIYRLTKVRNSNQKILGIKISGNQSDETLLSAFKLKRGMKLILMGQPDEVIEEMVREREDVGDVIDDFDFVPESVKAVAEREENLAKIQRRVDNIKIDFLNEPREGKKLIVLDIDYTLFDHRSVAERGEELMRPYLHEFLMLAYQFYDIIIWSATSMKWIVAKMEELGVAKSSHYKITAYMDSSSMISVHLPDRNAVVDVKPLGVIWGKFGEKHGWSPKNTLFVDDIKRNYVMNEKNGLKIRAFRNAHMSRASDRELVRLGKYIRKLALTCEDFTKAGDHESAYKRFDDSLHDFL